MDFDLGYKIIEKHRDGVQWYMMSTKDSFSSISFKFKNEKGNLVSFNGQILTFRLSFNEV